MKVLLVVIIFFIPLCIFSQPATPPSIGDGTSQDPYHISSWQNLNWMSQNSISWDKHFIQTADIYFPQSGANNIHNWDNGKGFLPISTNTHRFTGVYNGQGHIVDGLFIYRVESPGFNDIGLFAVLGEGGIIKNLGVTNVNISAHWRVGGVVGHNLRGQIFNCFSSGSISADTFIGGITGVNEGFTDVEHGVIQECFAIVNITGLNNVGGLVGENKLGKIINSYSRGDVHLGSFGHGHTGGLVGWNRGGEIKHSYSTGSVYSDVTQLSNKGFVGGEDSFQGNDPVYIANFFDKDRSNQNTSIGATAKTTVEMKSLFTFEEWNFLHTWMMSSIAVSGYPHLIWEGVEPRNQNPPFSIGPTYQLNSLDDLRWVAEDVQRWTFNYILTANIDASATINWDSGAGWTPIGTNYTDYRFEGTFNGQNNTISNLFINRPHTECVGLFGFVAEENAVLQNINLHNVDITGQSDVGGLAGRIDIYSSVQNCHVSGTLNSTGNHSGGLVGYNLAAQISNSSSSATVNGHIWVGGLVGLVFDGTVMESFSSGNVSGNNHVGGFAGYSNNLIINCYSIGDVSFTQNGAGFLGYSLGSDTYYCYHAGNVDSGTSTDRGFCGYTESVSTFIGNYFDAELSGQISGIGAEAKSTAEMKDILTFEDWDFSEIWNIDMTNNDNNGYPSLSWQNMTHYVPLTLTTEPAQNVTLSSATLNGSVLRLGNSNPYQHGFCWNTTGNPTISDNPIDYGAIDTPGSYSAELTGLNPNTLYYIRSFASNATEGTVYGEEIIFTTFIPENIAGNAYFFDGPNTYVQGSGIPADLTEISLEAWIYNKSLPEGTIGRYVTINPEMAVLRYDGTIYGGYRSLHFYIKRANGSIFSVRSHNTLTLDEWVHIAGTYDGNDMKLYLNGELIASASVNDDLYAPSGTFRINAPTENAHVVIDEVRVWRRARTAQELREFMHFPPQGSEQGLVSYWQFNEDSGNVIIDSASGNDGTLYNIGSSDRITSTLPFGEGSYYSQTIESSGLYDFGDTDLELNISTLSGSIQLSVAKIDSAPNVNPPDVSTTFDSSYWVVQSYGEESFTGDLTLFVEDGLNANDDNYPDLISLYARPTGSDGNWDYSLPAVTVVSSNGSAAFSNITGFSQLIVAREIVAPPEDLTIIFTASTPELSWSPSYGAVSYSVYSSSNAYAEFPGSWTLEESDITDTNWTDNNPNNIRKFYIVVATN